jgi:hypothetical protein
MTRRAGAPERDARDGSVGVADHGGIDAGVRAGAEQSSDAILEPRASGSTRLRVEGGGVERFKLETGVRVGADGRSDASAGALRQCGGAYRRSGGEGKKVDVTAEARRSWSGAEGRAGAKADARSVRPAGGGDPRTGAELRRARTDGRARRAGA